MLTSVHTVWDTRIYHREAMSLAQAGYKVTLIATGVKSQKTPVENIDIVGLERPKRRIGRALNWYPFIKAALQTEADIYHFHDPDLLFVGFALKLFTKKPVIYDNHDPYIEAILQREWLPVWLRPIISKMFNVIEKAVAGQLTVIIANDIQQIRFPQATLVRNYPNLKPFKLALNKQASPQIIHAGLLSEPRGAFELIDIAKLTEHKNIPFLLLGPFVNEHLEAEIKQKVIHYGLQHLIEFEGRVPHRRIISGLMNASIGLIPFRAVSNHLMINPTKLFEYMACALPVVASDLPPIRHYVTEAECGLLATPEEPQAFAKAIEYLLDHPEEARRMGQNGRKAAFEKYNWESEEQKLLTLYRKLLS